MNPVGNRRNCKNKPGKKCVIVRRMGCGTSKVSSPEPQVRARDVNIALENIGEGENEQNSNDDSALEISIGFYSPPVLISQVQNVETQGTVQEDEQSIVQLTESEASEENNGPVQTPVSNNESVDADQLCIPKTTFKRIAKNYICKYKRNYRLSCDAADILQFASEDYMAGVFRDSMKCCFHRQRKTVSVDDMKLVMDLRESNPHRISLPTE